MEEEILIFFRFAEMINEWLFPAIARCNFKLANGPYLRNQLMWPILHHAS